MNRALSYIALVAMLILTVACRSVRPASQEDVDRLGSRLAAAIEKVERPSGKYTRTVTLNGNVMRSVDEDGTERVHANNFSDKLEVDGDLRGMAHDPVLRAPASDPLANEIRRLKAATPAQQTGSLSGNGQQFGGTTIAPPPPVRYRKCGRHPPIGGDCYCDLER